MLCRLQRADPGVSDWRKLGTVYGPPVVRLDSEHGIEVRGEAEVR